MLVRLSVKGPVDQIVAGLPVFGEARVSFRRRAAIKRSVCQAKEDAGFACQTLKQQTLGNV